MSPSRPGRLRPSEGGGGICLSGKLASVPDHPTCTVNIHVGSGPDWGSASSLRWGSTCHQRPSQPWHLPQGRGREGPVGHPLGQHCPRLDCRPGDLTSQSPAAWPASGEEGDRVVWPSASPRLQRDLASPRDRAAWTPTVRPLSHGGRHVPSSPRRYGQREGSLKGAQAGGEKQGAWESGRGLLGLRSPFVLNCTGDYFIPNVRTEGGAVPTLLGHQPPLPIPPLWPRGHRRVASTQEPGGRQGGRAQTVREMKLL